LWAQLGSNQRPPDYESPFLRYIIRFKKVEIFEVCSTFTVTYDFTRL
jgi:hypothetical protein